MSGAFAEAVEEFYTPDSTMQENQSAPRVGRDPEGFVLANMLIGACVSHMLSPSAQVSNEAMLDALVEILLRVLQPQASAPSAPVQVE